MSKKILNLLRAKSALSRAMAGELSDFVKSKNVREKTRNITHAQADARREQYANKLGLKVEQMYWNNPAHYDEDLKGNKYPRAHGSKLRVGGLFGVDHELAHAMMTPEGRTVRQHQKFLTDNASYDDEKDYRTLGEHGHSHVRAVDAENIARVLEDKIDRRAGVRKPNAFRSRSAIDDKKHFDTSAQQMPADGAGGVESLMGPDEGSEDYHRRISEEASRIARQFDEGLKTFKRGKVVARETLDTKISQRVKKG